MMRPQYELTAKIALMNESIEYAESSSDKSSAYFREINLVQNRYADRALYISLRAKLVNITVGVGYVKVFRAPSNEIRIIHRHLANLLVKYRPDVFHIISE